MQLTFDQIKNAAWGVVAIEEQQDGIHFYRFRQDQVDHYEKNDPDFHRKTFATAGVRLIGDYLRLPDFFSEQYLHPNNMRFLYYAHSLYEAIRNED